jgi:hypothetical protein
MVFISFLVLTGLSAIAMITGFAWMLATSGRTRRRSGPEVGAEIMGGQMAEEGETLALVVLYTVGRIVVGFVRA